MRLLTLSTENECPEWLLSTSCRLTAAGYRIMVVDSNGIVVREAYSKCSRNRSGIRK